MNEPKPTPEQIYIKKLEEVAQLAEGFLKDPTWPFKRLEILKKIQALKLEKGVREAAGKVGAK